MQVYKTSVLFRIDILNPYKYSHLVDCSSLLVIFLTFCVPWEMWRNLSCGLQVKAGHQWWNSRNILLCISNIRHCILGVGYFEHLNVVRFTSPLICSGKYWLVCLPTVVSAMYLVSFQCSLTWNVLKESHTYLLHPPDFFSLNYINWSWFLFILFPFYSFSAS